MDGFQRSLLVAAVIALAGAVVAFVLVRPHEMAEAPGQDAIELAA